MNSSDCMTRVPKLYMPQICKAMAESVIHRATIQQVVILMKRAFFSSKFPPIYAVTSTRQEHIFLISGAYVQDGHRLNACAVVVYRDHMSWTLQYFQEKSDTPFMVKHQTPVLAPFFPKSYIKFVVDNNYAQFPPPFMSLGSTSSGFYLFYCDSIKYPDARMQCMESVAKFFVEKKKRSKSDDLWLDFRDEGITKIICSSHFDPLDFEVVYISNRRGNYTNRQLGALRQAQKGVLPHPTSSNTENKVIVERFLQKHNLGHCLSPLLKNGFTNMEDLYYTQQNFHFLDIKKSDIRKLRMLCAKLRSDLQLADGVFHMQLSVFCNDSILYRKKVIGDKHIGNIMKWNVSSCVVLHAWSQDASNYDIKSSIPDYKNISGMNMDDPAAYFTRGVTDLLKKLMPVSCTSEAVYRFENISVLGQGRWICYIGSTSEKQYTRVPSIKIGARVFPHLVCIMGIEDNIVPTGKTFVNRPVGNTSKKNTLGQVPRAKFCEMIHKTYEFKEDDILGRSERHRRAAYTMAAFEVLYDDVNEPNGMTIVPYGSGKIRHCEYNNQKGSVVLGQWVHDLKWNASGKQFVYSGRYIQTAFCKSKQRKNRKKKIALHCQQGLDKTEDLPPPIPPIPKKKQRGKSWYSKREENLNGSLPVPSSTTTEEQKKLILRQVSDNQKGDVNDENDAMTGLCVVCLDARSKAVIAPCGHQCLCIPCARNVKDIYEYCPICNARMKCIIEQIYVS